MKRSVNMAKAVLMALAFVAMMFVTMSCCRLYYLCENKGLAYFMGCVVGIAGIALVYFAFIILHFIMDKWSMPIPYQTAAFAISIGLIVAFVCYLILFGVDFITGRDITIEACLVLGYIVTAIIGIVKTIKDKWRW